MYVAHSLTAYGDMRDIHRIEWSIVDRAALNALAYDYDAEAIASRTDRICVKGGLNHLPNIFLRG